MAFSPDGTKIVSGSDDNTIKVWDLLGYHHYDICCYDGNRFVAIPDIRKSAGFVYGTYRRYHNAASAIDEFVRESADDVESAAAIVSAFMSERQLCEASQTAVKSLQQLTAENVTKQTLAQLSPSEVVQLLGDKLPQVLEHVGRTNLPMVLAALPTPNESLRLRLSVTQIK